MEIHVEKVCEVYTFQKKGITLHFDTDSTNVMKNDLTDESETVSKRDGNDERSYRIQ